MNRTEDLPYTVDHSSNMEGTEVWVTVCISEEVGEVAVWGIALGYVKALVEDRAGTTGRSVRPVREGYSSTASPKRGYASHTYVFWLLDTES